MNNKLKYTDERDKAYGLTGMVIALVMADGEEMLVEVSLDAPAGESMRFSPDFYFNGNPRFSAKIAWKQMLQQFSLSTGMLLGNIMCRNYVLNNSRLADNIVDELKNLVREQGAEICSLDSDESDQLFGRNFNYFDRLFSHQLVNSISHDFAGKLQSRRSMSVQEILEQLSQLSRL